jgi:hypothetical protein
VSHPTILNNNRPRKNLASQLDRMDSILDALAIGLNEAVATVVEKAVKEAVQAAVAETLAAVNLHNQNAAPALTNGRLAKFAAQVKGATLRVAGLVNTGCRSLAGFVGRTWNATARTVRAGHAAVCGLALNLVAKAKAVTSSAWLWTLIIVQFIRKLRRPLSVAASVGLVVGMACYLAGPFIASTVSAVTSGFVTLIIRALPKIGRREARPVAVPVPAAA